MVVMYSISPAVAALSEEAGSYYFTRHLLAFAIGVVGMLVVYRIPVHILKKAVPALATLSILACGLIIILDGFAFRWIKIAGFSFQPAEMMKFTLIIGLGFFLAQARLKGEQGDFNRTIKPVLIVSAVLGIILVVVQRDLGSMVVLASIIVAMLWVSGMPFQKLMMGVLVLGVLAGLAIVSTPYRRARFETFLNPTRDCQNEGYHACQALIAVGSGGVMGLGVGNSVQAYGYLPETPTDSIFAIYAEKFGLLGTVTMLILIGAVVLRLITIAERSTNWPNRLIVIGITTWIGVQSAINIGAMVGLIPLKGITLPFISYGGSSLIFVMLAMGVALRISCYTGQRKTSLEKSIYINENSTMRRRDRRTYHTPLSSR
jgi:cell division protein FtsW